MKRLRLLLLFLTLSASLLALPLVPHDRASGNPGGCDQYGDCASASLTYIRSNLNGTLYLGDQFEVTARIVLGPNSTGYSLNWSYDFGALGATSSGNPGQFVLLANPSQMTEYTVSAIVTVEVQVTTGNTTTTVSSQVAASVSVVALPFVLHLSVSLVPATTPEGQVRENPDGTFYPFDGFEVEYSYSFGGMNQRSDIAVDIEPSYNASLVQLTSSQPEGGSGSFHFEILNATGASSILITAKAYNWQDQVLGLATSSVPYTVIPFVLDLSSKLENVTCSAGCVLRNADGTFYKGDAFTVVWNATFQFESQRTDIRVNLTSMQIPQLNATLLSVLPRGLGGTFLYNVTTSHPYSTEGVELVAQAYDYYNDSLGLRAGTQGYAVVKYQPMFTYMTYMEYNYLNSSAYQRPFVTLVRYGGNQPGYSSPGGMNWGPFDALNATGERAYIDNFAFSTTGWNASTAGASNTEVVTYTPSPGVEAGTKLLNTTSCSQEFTWSNRVEKYYFENTNITDYVLRGVVYFNTTTSAWSQNFPYADDHQSLFNTSYLQEPILYNGYVTFQTYDGTGRLDPAVSNITVRVTNPDPLDPYLISKVVSVFGNDSSVISAFKADLYAAYSSMTLVPIQQGDGEWTFLVNQTNVSLPGDLSSPTYTVSVVGQSSGSSDYSYLQSIPFSSYQGPGGAVASLNYTYTFQGAFSLALANGSAASSPFSRMTLYYFEPRGSLFMRPLNFTSFPQVGLYLVQSLNSSTPYAALSTIPGGATHDYMFVWGQNTTVPVDIEGGLSSVAGPLIYEGGTEFQVTLLIGQATGGGTAAWVEDQGGVLVNQTLGDSWPSLSSWAPPGYFGLETIVFDAHPGDTSVTLYLKNSWGAEAVLTIPLPSLGTSTPLDSTVLITAVFLLTIGFYFLGELNRRIDRQSR